MGEKNNFNETAEICILYSWNNESTYSLVDQQKIYVQ